jgi:hypothetical protein
MEKFTASNGVEITVDEDGDYTFTGGERAADRWVVRPGGANETALREFFQAERDAELGRWRWSEHPEYVVYRVPEHDDDDGRSVRIMRETDGFCCSAWERLGDGDIEFFHAARAYFDAHPVPRPWENAKPGEVWVLTGAGGVEQPWRRDNGFWLSCTTGARKYDAERATSGRRIWPEDETTP